MKIALITFSENVHIWMVFFVATLIIISISLEYIFFLKRGAFKKKIILKILSRTGYK